MMKHKMLWCIALCLMLCLACPALAMESDGMDDDEVEFEEIEGTPMDEALTENLAELDNPEKPLIRCIVC